MSEKMRALILAGGLGKRLRKVVRDVPKPMAPVAGKPFLEYLILRLIGWDVRDIVFSTGYMGEKIRSYFCDGNRWGVRISYSEEIEPLGTGGALRKAMSILKDEEFLVMNGDSFLSVDLGDLVSFHRKRSATVTMGLVKVDDTGRYGRVEVNGAGEVEGFLEKGVKGPGIINGGVYVFHRNVMDVIPGGQVSLEKEVLPALIKRGLYGMVARGFFVDIGIPEDYQRLCSEPEGLLSLAGEALDNRDRRPWGGKGVGRC